MTSQAFFRAVYKTTDDPCVTVLGPPQRSAPAHCRVQRWHWSPHAELCWGRTKLPLPDSSYTSVFRLLAKVSGRQ